MDLLLKTRVKLIKDPEDLIRLEGKYPTNKVLSRRWLPVNIFRNKENKIIIKHLHKNVIILINYIGGFDEQCSKDLPIEFKDIPLIKAGETPSPKPNRKLRSYSNKDTDRLSKVFDIPRAEARILLDKYGNISKLPDYQKIKEKAQKEMTQNRLRNKQRKELIELIKPKKGKPAKFKGLWDEANRIFKGKTIQLDWLIAHVK